MTDPDEHFAVLVDAGRSRSMDSRALNPDGKFTEYWAWLMIRTL